MSVSSLLEINTPAYASKSVRAYDIIADHNLSANELTVVGGITADSILFSNNTTLQTPLNVYNTDGVDYLIDLTDGMVTNGQLVCRFSRIGDIVFAEIRGDLTIPVPPAISQAIDFIPFIYRPPHQIAFSLPMQTPIGPPTAVNAICHINTLGVISIPDFTPAAGVGLLYSAYRYTFCYRV